MEDIRCNGITPSDFKSSTLIDLYIDQLKHHGAGVEYRTQASRFKDRLLTVCPDLTAINHGREVMLTYNENLGIALKQIKDSSDSGAIHLMLTAKLIRQELFMTNSGYFNRSFDENSQKDSVPQLKISLVGMLLEGPGNFEVSGNRAALSIAQLIKFNAIYSDLERCYRLMRFKGRPLFAIRLVRKFHCLFIWGSCCTLQLARRN